jgi:hypothetical protein
MAMPGDHQLVTRADNHVVADVGPSPRALGAKPFLQRLAENAAQELVEGVHGEWRRV